MKMGQTECSETSAIKIQTPGNYPEENIQLSQHGESLKSRIHPGMSTTCGFIPVNEYELCNCTTSLHFIIFENDVEEKLIY
jgi:hypothetical protein